MADSSSIFARLDGSPLLAIPSLSALRSLDTSSLHALRGLGIHTIADLLSWPFVLRARVLVMLSRGQSVHDVAITDYLAREFESLTEPEYAGAPIAAVRGIGPSGIAILRDSFGVERVEQLAEFAPYVEALALISTEPRFSEPPSAPPELLPRMLGGISSSARYSSFVRERAIRSGALAIELGSDAEEWVDRSLAQLFETDHRIELHLGYVCGYVQRWLSWGTVLGEPIYSLPLAPGESRNVSIVDWKRSLLASRTESTGVSESLENVMVHKRALDEVVRATANEHLTGETKMSGGTLSAGVGGALGEGTSAGAGGGLSAKIGIAQGGVQGSGSANQSGGIGAVVSGNYQRGHVETASEGHREISAETAQNINDVASQNASALRSLWSTVVVTDNQQESASASTYNVTNYNHSHALTVQYFEVLQRYRVEMLLNRCEPVLFVPFRPLTFDEANVRRWWSVLRAGIADATLVMQFDAVVRQAGAAEMPPVDSRETALVTSVQLELVETPRNEISGDMMQGVRWDRTTGDDLGFTGGGTQWTLRSFASSTLGAVNPMRVEIEVRKNLVRKRTLVGRMTATVSVDSRTWQIPVDIETEFKEAVGKSTIEVDWIAAMRGYAAAPAQTSVQRVLEYIAARRYYFTRLVLQSVEPEQFVDMVQAIWIVGDAPEPAGGRDIPTGGLTSNDRSARPDPNPQPTRMAIHLPLVALIEPEPVGTVDNMFIFPLKRHIDIPGSLEPVAAMPPLRAPWSALSPIPPYAGDLAEWAEQTRRKGALDVEEIDLPTSGTFAEAILGRSNASEKIDLTRFWNWQDSPIPNAAPAVAAASTDSRAQSSPDMTPTQPNAVLNLMAPTSLPDPTGLAAALAAVQNGGMFRDATGQALLGQTLASLASLAARTAEVAGQLGGDAAARALESANSLGQQVMQATKGAAESGGGGGGVMGLIGKTLSGIGGGVNEVTKLWDKVPSLGDVAGAIPGPGDAARKIGEALDVRDMMGLPRLPSHLPWPFGSGDAGASGESSTGVPSPSGDPLDDVRERIVRAAQVELGRNPPVDEDTTAGRDRIKDYWAHYYDPPTRETVDRMIAAAEDPVETERDMLSLWCNVLAVHCWVTAGASFAPRELDQFQGGGCTRLMKWFNHKHRWLSANQTPKKGDMIFFGTSEDSGHVGIVVSAVNGVINTIEGNLSGKIDEGQRTVTGNRGVDDIIGYGSVDE